MFIKTQLGSLVNLSNSMYIVKREKLIVVEFEPLRGLNVAQYETEERAQEVLNEIYKALARGESTYTMPEE